MRLKRPLLPLMAVGSLVLEIIDPSRVWLALVVMFWLAWLVSYLWARSLREHVSLMREMRFGWAQVGDRMEERLSISNTGWAPVIWAEVRDESTLPGVQSQDNSVNRVTGVDGGSRVEWKVQSVLQRRGQFTLGPTSLETSDVFGLYSVTIKNPAQRSILVSPPIIPLPRLAVAPGRRTGDERPPRSTSEKTLSAFATRLYQPGDSLRWIHWRSSAHHGELFVRLFDESPAGDWHLLVDMNQNVHVGQGEDSTEEHAVILAASLLERALRVGRAVGLAITGEPFTWLPARPQEGRRWELLRLLALAHCADRPLVEVFRRLGSSLPKRSSLVVITPDISGDWLQELLMQSRRGVTASVLVLDPNVYPGAHSLQSAEVLFSELARKGIQHSSISRETFDRPEARPGQEGQWEFKVTGLGRAIPVRRPMDMDWKKLG